MYAPVLRMLHHLMAGLIVIMVGLGLFLPHLDEGPLASFLYETHKTIGILVLVLVILRLGLRLALGTPADPVSVPPALYRLAKMGHGLLYGLMIVVPILGYSATSMCCAPVLFLGAIPVPVSLTGSEDLMKKLFLLHEWGAWMLGLVAAGHVAMGFVHYRQNDGVYARMWPDHTSSGGQA
jgi:cytochrome b561